MRAGDQHYKIWLINEYMRDRQELIKYLLQKNKWKYSRVTVAIRKELHFLSGRLCELYRDTSIDS